MSPTRVSRLSRLENAIRTVLAFNEAFNRHDVIVMLQLLTKDCVFEDTSPAPDGTRYTGTESLGKYWSDHFSVFPNVHMKIEEVFGLGNRCIMRWRCERGEYGGGQDHVRGVDIFQVREGLICEKLSYTKSVNPNLS